MVFQYKKNRVWAESAHIVMQIGLTMAGCIIFCFFVGRWIDGAFDTRGIFTTLFTVLGVIGGANVVYRQIMEITTDKPSAGNRTKTREDD
jgi:ATP synthase protein I